MLIALLTNYKTKTHLKESYKRDIFCYDNFHEKTILVKDCHFSLHVIRESQPSGCFHSETTNVTDLWLTRFNEVPIHKIIILGKSGIGKTTMCKYITFSWANDRLWNFRYKYVFYIALDKLKTKEWRDSYSGVDLKHVFCCFLHHCSKEAKLNINKLIAIDQTKRNQVLLLIDGLDINHDCNDDSLKSYSTDVANIISAALQYPNYIVFSRNETSENSANSLLKSANLVCTLSGHSGYTIKHYYSQYFLTAMSTLNEKKRQQQLSCYQSFRRVLINSSTIHSKCKHPAFLTMLCSVWQRQFNANNIDLLHYTVSLCDVYGLIISTLSGMNSDSVTPTHPLRHSTVEGNDGGDALLCDNTSIHSPITGITTQQQVVPAISNTTVATDVNVLSYLSRSAEKQLFSILKRYSSLTDSVLASELRQYLMASILCDCLASGGNNLTDGDNRMNSNERCDYDAALRFIGDQWHCNEMTTLFECLVSLLNKSPYVNPALMATVWAKITSSSVYIAMDINNSTDCTIPEEQPYDCEAYKHLVSLLKLLSCCCNCGEVNSYVPQEIVHIVETVIASLSLSMQREMLTKTGFYTCNIAFAYIDQLTALLTTLSTFDRTVLSSSKDALTMWRTVSIHVDILTRCESLTVDCREMLISVLHRLVTYCSPITGWSVVHHTEFSRIIMQCMEQSLSCLFRGEGVRNKYVDDLLTTVFKSGSNSSTQLLTLSALCAVYKPNHQIFVYIVESLSVPLPSYYVIVQALKTLDFLWDDMMTLHLMSQKQTTSTTQSIHSTITRGLFAVLSSLSMVNMHSAAKQLVVVKLVSKMLQRLNKNMVTHFVTVLTSSKNVTRQENNTIVVSLFTIVHSGFVIDKKTVLQIERQLLSLLQSDTQYAFMLDDLAVSTECYALRTLMSPDLSRASDAVLTVFVTKLNQARHPQIQYYAALGLLSVVHLVGRIDKNRMCFAGTFLTDCYTRMIGAAYPGLQHTLLKLFIKYHSSRSLLSLETLVTMLSAEAYHKELCGHAIRIILSEENKIQREYLFTANMYSALNTLFIAPYSSKSLRSAMFTPMVLCVTTESPHLNLEAWFSAIMQNNCNLYPVIVEVMRVVRNAVQSGCAHLITKKMMELTLKMIVQSYHAEIKSVIAAVVKSVIVHGKKSVIVDLLSVFNFETWQAVLAVDAKIITELLSTHSELMTSDIVYVWLDNMCNWRSQCGSAAIVGALREVFLRMGEVVIPQLGLGNPDAGCTASTGYLAHGVTARCVAIELVVETHPNLVTTSMLDYLLHNVVHCENAVVSALEVIWKTLSVGITLPYATLLAGLKISPSNRMKIVTLILQSFDSADIDVSFDSLINMYRGVKVTQMVNQSTLSLLDTIVCILKLHPEWCNAVLLEAVLSSAETSSLNLEPGSGVHEFLSTIATQRSDLLNKGLLLQCLNSPRSVVGVLKLIQIIATHGSRSVPGGAAAADEVNLDVSILYAVRNVYEKTHTHQAQQYQCSRSALIALLAILPPSRELESVASNLADMTAMSKNVYHSGYGLELRDLAALVSSYPSVFTSVTFEYVRDKMDIFALSNSNKQHIVLEAIAAMETLQIAINADNDVDVSAVYVPLLSYSYTDQNAHFVEKLVASVGRIILKRPECFSALLCDALLSIVCTWQQPKNCRLAVVTAFKLFVPHINDSVISVINISLLTERFNSMQELNGLQVGIHCGDILLMLLDCGHIDTLQSHGVNRQEMFDSLLTVYVNLGAPLQSNDASLVSLIASLLTSTSSAMAPHDGNLLQYLTLAKQVIPFCKRALIVVDAIVSANVSLLSSQCITAVLTLLSNSASLHSSHDKISCLSILEKVVLKSSDQVTLTQLLNAFKTTDGKTVGLYAQISKLVMQYITLYPNSLTHIHVDIIIRKFTDRLGDVIIELFRLCLHTRPDLFAASFILNKMCDTDGDKSITEAYVIAIGECVVALGVKGITHTTMVNQQVVAAMQTLIAGGGIQLRMSSLYFAAIETLFRVAILLDDITIDVGKLFNDIFYNGIFTDAHMMTVSRVFCLMCQYKPSLLTTTRDKNGDSILWIVAALLREKNSMTVSAISMCFAIVNYCCEHLTYDMIDALLLHLYTVDEDDSSDAKICTAYSVLCIALDPQRLGSELLVQYVLMSVYLSDEVLRSNIRKLLSQLGYVVSGQSSGLSRSNSKYEDSDGKDITIMFDALEYFEHLCVL